LNHVIFTPFLVAFVRCRLSISHFISNSFHTFWYISFRVIKTTVANSSMSQTLSWIFIILTFKIRGKVY
jgi:hypothetical protein